MTRHGEALGNEPTTEILARKSTSCQLPFGAEPSQVLVRVTMGADPDRDGIQRVVALNEEGSTHVHAARYRRGFEGVRRRVSKVARLSLRLRCFCPVHIWLPLLVSLTGRGLRNFLIVVEAERDAAICGF